MYVGALKVSELNDQDNITYDESESRIIGIGLTIAMVISLVIFGQIIQIYVLTTKKSTDYCGTEIARHYKCIW